jgi:transcriptional regulator with XRE-family HTH domain
VVRISNQAALRPAQIVAQRIREAREAKTPRWSQARLVDELRELGYVKSRSTLTKLEAGDSRQVSVDDLFAVAAGLGVAPVFLLTPADDDAMVAVAPRVQLPAWAARRWIRGEPTPMLPDTDVRQIPESELVQRIEQWYARSTTAVAYALAKDSLHESAVRLARELRNAPTNEG